MRLLVPSEIKWELERPQGESLFHSHVIRNPKPKEREPSQDKCSRVEGRFRQRLGRPKGWWKHLQKESV